MRKQKTPIRLPRRERFPSSSSLNQTTPILSPSSSLTSPATTTPNSASSYGRNQRSKHIHWKETLKQKCMERAREKRKQMIQKRRISSKPLMVDEFENEMEVDLGRNCDIRSNMVPLQLSNINGLSNFNQMINDSNHTSMSETARTLIQEELEQNNIKVKSYPMQRNFNHQKTSSSDIDMSNPCTRSQSMNQHYLEDFVLDEDELILLMQEVEEELQREEEQMEREIDDFESHHIQEQMMLNEQIEDFEMWQQQQANG